VTGFDLPPQPVPDNDTEPFWDAVSSGALAMCRCQSCGLWHQPPLERCRRCVGATAFEPIRGTGELYSFIVVRQPAVPGYLEVPYVVGLVELDEQPGLRLPARLVEVEPEEVRVGMRVRARLEPLAGGDFSVATFVPD
jgi:uncharacterized protein